MRSVYVTILLCFTVLFAQAQETGLFAGTRVFQVPDKLPYVKSLGENIIMAQRGSSYISVYDYIDILADSTKKLSFHEVLSPPWAQKFQPNETQTHSYHKNMIYWLRIKMKGNRNLNQKIALNFFNEFASVQVYYPEGWGKYKVVTTGQVLSPDQKKEYIPAASICYVPFEPFEEKDVYIRLEPLKKGTHTYIDIGITDYEKVYDSSVKEFNIQRIIAAIFLVMALYNALFFFMTNDKLYLYYFFMVLGFMLTTSNFYFYQYFSNETTERLILLPLLIASFAAFIKFGDNYLNLKTQLPSWHTVVYITTITMLALIVAFFLDYLFIKNTSIPFFIISFISWMVLITSIIIMLISAIKSFIRGSRSAVFFLSANALFIVSIFFSFGLIITAEILIMTKSVQLPEWVYYAASYTPTFALIVQIVMFSMGLGDKFNRLEREKTQAIQKNLELQKILNRDLERKVKERTSEIEQKNQELLELNKEKNHLIGVVAHDLRNPLTSTISIAEQLKSEKLSSHQMECMSYITVALARMNQMVNQILDIPAIESKKLNIDLQPMEVSSVIKQVLKNYEEAAHKKQITIHQKMEPLFIFADVNFVTQVVDNLVSNALKFTPFDKNIYISLHRVEKNIRIEVKDEGPGISQGDRKKMFGRFQRLSAQPTGGEKSTGLGLSIVKKYVEALNGNVWCESEPGQGTTFIVEFCEYHED